MGITKDGIKGEQKLFKLLRNKNYKEFFQPDAIGLKDDEYYIFEAKCQERFVKPPFDGHGLPKWQVKARLNFQEKTKIKTILVIFDKETNEVFWQFLDKLNNGNFFDTHGLKPRRIYPLDSFKIIQEQTRGIAGRERV